MLKETFLNSIKNRHPNNFIKYDYSLIPDEFKSVDKILIQCLIHGVFEQKVDKHLFGCGCPACKFDKLKDLCKSNTEEFIKRAIDIHGNDYTYPRTNYTGSNNKLIITCPVHGDFEQTANNHLNGQGCAKCGLLKSSMAKFSNTEEFIRKAISVHADKDDYSKVVYINSQTKVIIICKIHGEYLQTPDSHLRGRRCPKCKAITISKYRNSNKEEFVRKAFEIHGTKYGYDKFDYNGSSVKRIITCLVHGDFLQTPSDHLNGCGCPKCRESHGEKYISQILDKYNIQYNREYRIPEYPYRYDFYLPEYNVYIEYHGRQHYIPIDYFGGQKALDYIQRNDKTKIELIKRSNGLLITLKHLLNTIEKIEDELIRLFSYIHSNFFTDVNTTKQAIIDSNIYLIEDGISYKRK